MPPSGLSHVPPSGLAHVPPSGLAHVPPSGLAHVPPSHPTGRACPHASLCCKGGFAAFVDSNALSSLMQHIAPTEVRSSVKSAMSKVKVGNWGFSVCGQQMVMEMPGIGQVKLKKGLAVFSRFPLSDFGKLAGKALPGVKATALPTPHSTDCTLKEHNTDPVNQYDCKPLEQVENTMQIALSMSKQMVAFEIYMNNLPTLHQMMRFVGLPAGSGPTNKQMFQNNMVGQSNLNITVQNYPKAQLSVNVGWSKQYDSVPNRTRFAVQLKAGGGGFLIGVMVNHFRFSMLDNSLKWLDDMRIANCAIIYTKEFQPEVRFQLGENYGAIAHSDGGFSYTGVKAGLMLQGDINLLKSGTMIPKLGKFFTRGGRAVVRGRLTWSQEDSSLEMMFALSGVWPMCDFFSFGGVTTLQGECYAVEFAIMGKAPTFEISLSLCMTLNIAAHSIQLMGKVTFAPATLAITIALMMRTPLKLFSWLTVLPSGFLIGMGPITYSTGVPQSLGLATGMIMGSDPKTAIKWTFNFYAPSLPLAQFVFRGTMEDRLNLLNVVRMWFPLPLGPLEPVLESCYLKSVFVQLSTIPFAQACDICICDPTVDHCPGPVIFQPGVAISVQEFGLFGIIKGGVHLEIQYSATMFKFKFAAWLDPFHLGPLYVSGYKEPDFGFKFVEEASRTDLVQEDSSRYSRISPRHMVVDRHGVPGSDVKHLPWVPTEDAAHGDHHELARQFGTGPGAVERELNHRLLDMGAKEGQHAEKNPVRDCEMSEWSAWSACSRSCGAGLRHRSKRVLKEALEGGARCPSAAGRAQSELCNTFACQAMCPKLKNCGDCAAAKECGWCPTSNRCVEGTPEGPIAKNTAFCPGWSFDVCVNYKVTGASGLARAPLPWLEPPCHGFHTLDPPCADVPSHFMLLTPSDTRFDSVLTGL